MKHTILFLPANPTASTQAAFAAQAHAIQTGLQRGSTSRAAGSRPARAARARRRRVGPDQPTFVPARAVALEAHAVQTELLRGRNRDRFAFVTCWAVQPLDVLRELRRHKPTIVH